ncbi:endolytic transglycosylase MltG [Arthrobacter sp. H41]|uniref:endolytic transglycosylase MltG n=1 Tax=Arthrobacter sp. H41 TaxID=1312978 RepID=UPI00047E74BB|nr:endolytic transglycosylase MltG [Arthrobacter sp. H41]
MSHRSAPPPAPHEREQPSDAGEYDDGPAHPEPIEQFFDTSDTSDTSDAEAPKPKSKASLARQRRRRRRTVVLVVVLLVFAGVVFGVAMMLRDLLGLDEVTDYAGPGGESIVFTVPQGAGSLAIGMGLESEDIVADSDVFISSLAAIADGREVQPGEYEMRRQMSSDGAAEALLGEDPTQVHYAAVARDLRQGEVFTVLSESTGIPVAEFEALAAAPAQFGLPEQARSLEGYLHPGEYRFDVALTAPEIIQQMVDNTLAQLEADGITDPAEQYRILTIASIVQAEAGEGDYASVAGSIMNRLGPDNVETNGLIQSDATVTYGLGRKSYDLTPEEKADTNNPYNTYANPGLPVGPIGSPSEEAIDAAADPADVPFFYWVTVNLDTGETKFSETLAEHARYVAEYQAWCADNPGRCL